MKIERRDFLVLLQKAEKWDTITAAWNEYNQQHGERESTWDETSSAVMRELTVGRNVDIPAIDGAGTPEPFIDDPFWLAKMTVDDFKDKT